MGRMFRIISEATTSIPMHPVQPQLVAPVRGRSSDGAEVIPFIEVGGPDGPVTSIPFSRGSAPVRPEPKPAETATVPAAPAEPKAEVRKPPVPPATPAPVPATRAALSVAIHKFSPRNPQLADLREYDDLIVVHEPDHPISHEYRAIADVMQSQLTVTGSRTVMVTAALPTSGTTTVVTNLAAVLATRGRGRVALVDANLLRPAIADRLNVRTTPGLVELLDQSVPMAWVVQPTSVERLSVIAAGRDLPENPSSLKDIPRLLSQLRDWFDWVLIDAGVWTESIAGDLLAPASDGVYFICRENQVDPGEFADLREIIEETGGHPRGYVTTRG